MSGKKETYVYGSLRERFALEWKIYALAFAFILVADNIGQIKIPVGKGMFIPVHKFLSVEFRLVLTRILIIMMLRQGISMITQPYLVLV